MASSDYLPPEDLFAQTPAIQKGASINAVADSESTEGSTWPRRVQPGSTITFDFVQTRYVNVWPAIAVQCAFAESAKVNDVSVPLTAKVGSLKRMWWKEYHKFPVPGLVAPQYILLDGLGRVLKEVNGKPAQVAYHLEIKLSKDFYATFDEDQCRQAEAAKLAHPGSAQYYTGPWLSIHSGDPIQGWSWYKPFNIVPPRVGDRDARRDKGCSVSGTLNLSFSALGTALGSFGLGLLSYHSLDYARRPSSLGWGWDMDLFARISEDTTGNPTFFDGTGRIEQWTLVGGSYVPVHADNTIQAVKTGGNYTLTFQDQTRMLFDSQGRIETLVDRNGNTLTYQYEPGPGGHLANVSDGKGRILYFVHGSDGQPTALRDTRTPAGGKLTSRETRFEYKDGRLSALVDPVGNRTRFLYDPAGRLMQVIDPRGRVSRAYTYYTEGEAKGRVRIETHYGEKRMTRKYDLSRNRTTLTIEDLVHPSTPARVHVRDFDGRYQLTREQDPLGNVWTYEYNHPGNPYLLTRSVDPNLSTTTYTYNARSDLATVTDTQGHKTEIFYAEDRVDISTRPLHANLVYEIHRPEVSVGTGGRQKYPPTRLRYDALGNLDQVVDPAGGVTHFERQADGQITAITDRLGNTTRLSYYPNGNLKDVTTPGGPDGAPARTTGFTYDVFDNPQTVTDPLGNIWRYLFDEGDRPTKVTDALGHSVSFRYVQGLLESVTAPPNAGSKIWPRKTHYTYDEAGRLSRISSHTSVTRQEMRARFDYTGLGELRRLVRLMNDAEKATSYSYDALGRLVTTADPLGRASTIAHAPFCNSTTETSARGVKRTYRHDTLCQVKEVEVPSGTTRYSYDEMGRLVSVTQPDGTLTGTYGSARYGADLYGGTGGGSETRTFLYDSLDRLVRVTFPDGKTQRYEYDAEGQLTRLTDASGKATSYAHYADGRLKTVRIERPREADRAFSYRYDAAGRLSEIVYPASTGIVCRFQDAAGNPGWNANGQLTHLRYLKNGAHFHSFEYSYDASGNRIKLVDTPQNLAARLVWVYGYDWLNRLSEVKKGVGSANPVTVSLYTYDESDNRLTLNLPAAGQLHSYVYDVADQLVERRVNGVVKETFSHDADGNMVARVLDPGLPGQETTRYTWNDYDSLVRWEKQPAGTTESHSYDSGGIRKSKIGTDGVKVEFKYSGLPVLSEKRDPSVSPTEWAFIHGHQVLGFQKASDLCYFVTDGLSSVRVMVDASGNEVAHYLHDEFGKRTEAVENGGSSSQTFVGALGVRDEGLYYMRQRWYEPSLGRFISPDPIRGENLFTYAANNPINLVDPMGLKPINCECAEDEALIRHDLENIAKTSQQAGGYFSEVQAGNNNWTIAFTSEGSLLRPLGGRAAATQRYNGGVRTIMMRPSNWNSFTYEQKMLYLTTLLSTELFQANSFFTNSPRFELVDGKFAKETEQEFQAHYFTVGVLAVSPRCASYFASRRPLPLQKKTYDYKYWRSLWALYHGGNTAGVREALRILIGLPR